MQKWEYKVISYYVAEEVGWVWNDGKNVDAMPLWDKLNQMGDSGWEYIERRRYDKDVETYLFKRPKE